MDFIVLLIVLLLVALVALPIAALVTSNNRGRELREEMADLLSRFRDLESKLDNLSREVAATHTRVEPPKAAPAATPVSPIMPVQVPGPLIPGPIHATQFSAPSPQPEPVQATAAVHPALSIRFAPASEAPVGLNATTPPKPSSEPIPKLHFGLPAAPEPKESTGSQRAFSLEERFGTNWLNKLGIALLVLGVAFFLAWKLQTWGPAGKVLCGFAVSAVLLAGGIWLEGTATYRIFARAGIGGGWALAFFTTFAMNHIPAARVLNSPVSDLVLMLLVAAAMVRTLCDTALRR